MYSFTVLPLAETNVFPVAALPTKAFQGREMQQGIGKLTLLPRREAPVPKPGNTNQHNRQQAMGRDG